MININYHSHYSHSTQIKKQQQQGSRHYCHVRIIWKKITDRIVVLVNIEKHHYDN